MKILKVGSPNFSSRGGKPIVGTVIHYTAGGAADGSIRWLCDPRAKASAHFVIARDGQITQLVDPDMHAWHAGVSEMMIDGEMRSDAGRYTVGIELANHGLLHNVDGKFFYEIGRKLYRYRRAEPVEATLAYDSGNRVSGWWEPYPDAQITGLKELLVHLKAAGYNRAVQNLIGHEEIGMPMGRKMDPGPLFPWERFWRKLPRRTSAAKE